MPPDKRINRNSAFLQTWQLYVFSLVPILLFLVFNYIPIFGNVIAFQNYSVRRGFLHSEFAGFKYFRQFFSMPMFWQYLRNTVLLNVYGLILGFPFPIVLALAFNELSNAKLKKTIQTITYAPYFISTVVMAGIVLQLFSYHFGIVNNFLRLIGQPATDLLIRPSFFRPIYIISGIWQGAGYASVLYIAALSAVDPSLYEAALIDGAARIQKVWYIDLPTILPTIVITLILNVGQLLSLSAEKVLLFQNGGNYSVSETIPTYVYKIGIQQAQFSLSTAIGLFNAAANFVLLFTVNKILKRVSGTGLI
jgi:putative aldouronate transport system permease protein